MSLHRNSIFLMIMIFSSSCSQGPQISDDAYGQVAVISCDRDRHRAGIRNNLGDYAEQRGFDFRYSETDFPFPAYTISIETDMAFNSVAPYGNDIQIITMPKNLDDADLVSGQSESRQLVIDEISQILIEVCQG